MKVYALKNNAYPESSSGGAFPTIADTLHKQAGDSLVVFGATFENDFIVKHRASKYTDGITQFQESKYVRSDIAEAIAEIVSLLRNNNPVMFAGTPCQVAAIYSAIQRENVSDDPLLTVDLICHGTPKKELWGKYLELIRNKYGNIKRVSFRNNSSQIEGKSYIILENEKTVPDPPELKTYMKLFSTNRSLYKGCFACKFRNEEISRPGDITIGDFWGVTEIIDSFKKVKNVSLVIANTSKGQGLIDTIDRNNPDLLIKECLDERFKIFNPHLTKQTPIPKDYNTFWADYYKMTIDQLNQKYSVNSIQYRMKRLISDILGRVGLKYKIKKIIHLLHS